VNEQDRYRGSGAERFSNPERGSGWRRDDDGSLLDRGDRMREAWSRERSGENEWQRDYGSRAQAPGPNRGYHPDSSRYGEAEPGERAFREQDRDYRGGASGYGRSHDYQQEWSGFGERARFDERDRERSYPYGSGAQRGAAGWPPNARPSYAGRDASGSSSYGAGPSYRGGWPHSSGMHGESEHGGNLAGRARGEFNYASTRLGGFSGRGPKGYTRSDERIREDVCEHLSENDEVDASDIEVMVKDRKVTLTGTVENRRMKHLAEDIAEMVSGVQDVDNRVTVRKPLLKDMADRIMGKEPEGHFANTGTKDTSPASPRQSANGRP
jgi:hypothetical protein